MKRVVLLGTGTDVGKTYVACRLAASLAQSGARVLASKPVESGVEGACGADARSLEEATVAKASTGRRATLGPSPHAYAFEEPISPHLAARRAGVALDLERVVAWVKSREEAFMDSLSGDPELQGSEQVGAKHSGVTSHVWSLVESAGGVFSPLSPEATNLDLAAALEPSFLMVVAPDRLGVLHDVGATLRAMAAAGRRADLVILSAVEATDASVGSNAAELESVVWQQLGSAAPRIPRVPRIARDQQEAEELLRLLVS